MNKIPDQIYAIHRLEEDHINPSGESLEPKSWYRPGGQFYEDDSIDKMTEEELEAETVTKSEGSIFFVAE